MYPFPPTVEQSNPNTLSFVIYSPVCKTLYGGIPSEPPWKGTVNFNCVFLGPLTPVVSIEALNEPAHNPEF